VVNLVSAKMVKAAEQIQRIAATSIIEAFKLIALVMAEVEADASDETVG
jgi:hypothetical protein